MTASHPMQPDLTCSTVPLQWGVEEEQGADTHHNSRSFSSPGGDMQEGHGAFNV